MWNGRKNTGRKMVKRIVIIGPESTGKSTLCEQLSAMFNTLWCPEFARQYLTEHGMNYNYEDLLTIAKGQLKLEDEIYEKVISFMGKGKESVPYFIDTDMYVMKVWCEFVFAKCHDFILKQIVERKYDLYLLCNVDLPWSKDELREYPDLESRQVLYKMYRDILINQDVPWYEVSGRQEERLSMAITAVKKILQ